MGARELLHELHDAGLVVQADGDRLVVRPASRLTDPLREAIRAAKPELLALVQAGSGVNLAAVAWTDAEISAFTARRARLLRWGWPEPDAEALAERLVIRDRIGDERSACVECRNYRPGRCASHARAGLHDREVGRDLAALLQRCPAFGRT